MADFELRWDDFESRGVKVVAASVDTLEAAGKTAQDLNLSFPLAYGLTPQELSDSTGAFWEEKRNIIHSTEFILNPEGNVAFAVYSTGPIGRYKADDCIRLIDFVRQAG